MSRRSFTRGLAAGILCLSFVGVDSVARSETEVGNGGAVVRGTCDGTDSTLQTAGELLDFWEVRYRYGIDPVLGGPQDSVDARLALAFQRLEVVDAARAQLYRTWYRSFWAEERDQEERLPLPPLRDVGNVTPLLPPGCSLEKIIEQKQPESQVFAKRYFIRRTRFNSLNTLTQAGLILHELVYRDALERGHRTSMKARLVTGMLASDWLTTATPDEYAAFMVEQGFVGYMTDVTPGTNFGVKRYFDHQPMSQADAANFCEHLGGDSHLAAAGDVSFVTWNNDGAQFRASAIGRRILDADNEGSSIFWLTEKAVGVDSTGYLDLQSALPAPGTLLPFVCWQETRFSPWTTQN